MRTGVALQEKTSDFFRVFLVFFLDGPCSFIRCLVLWRIIYLTGIYLYIKVDSELIIVLMPHRHSLSSHKLNSEHYIFWPALKSVYAGACSYCWIPKSVYHCPRKSSAIFIQKNIPLLLYLLLFSQRICRRVKWSTWDPRMWDYNNYSQNAIIRASVSKNSA